MWHTLTIKRIVTHKDAYLLAAIESRNICLETPLDVVYRVSVLVQSHDCVHFLSTCNISSR